MSTSSRLATMFFMFVLASFAYGARTVASIPTENAATTELHPTDRLSGFCSISNLRTVGKCACYVRWRYVTRKSSDKYISLCRRYTSKRPSTLSSSCRRYPRSTEREFRRAVARDFSKGKDCLKKLGFGSYLD